MALRYDGDDSKTTDLTLCDTPVASASRYYTCSI